MTALKRYQRLESPGVWREHADAQRKNVILSFGDASLVITDTAERVLTHWSLAALDRLNPGAVPALYAPDADSDEVLEVDDPLMIEALETVRDAVAKIRPNPGRLRLALFAAIAAGVAALGVFWLPGALVRHTVSVVPPQVRAEIGQDLLARVTRVAGQPCARTGGARALDRLAARLLPGQGARVVVLPSGMPRAAHLPGGLILLNRALVEDHEDASAVAGFILAEAARADRTDPLAVLLDTAGVLATFKLLTSGHLPERALEAHARTVLAAPAAPLPEPTLLARFAAAGVPSTPYAYALDVSGEGVLGLIEADPMRGQSAVPLLSDGDWVQLQAICGS
ncbi:hypothetical protein [Rhodovulum euryhalinum]|uniref:Uncharacterized protein n=1 Tax=Rhodovulum euryhalinum TaxID=35805 RepID=A0A4R2L1J4_9RHOB|nr:hypothetical protein [Rhodovulum euryhalinum]TCO72895.1 hypothetical protein EV655_103124 [Rhodovulum euryhalinum]